MKKRWMWAVLAVLVLLMALLLLGKHTALEQVEAETRDWNGWEGTAVFLGDSITELCDLSVYYNGLNAVNRGISGDTTGGMLDRLGRSVLELEPAPDIVLVQGGINDLYTGVPEDDIVDNIRAIVRKTKETLPEAGVIVQSIYPVSASRGMDLNGAIRRVNARLKALTEEEGCLYADVHAALAAEDGALAAGYADDGLHPSVKGYRAVAPVVSDAILAVIRGR